MKSIFNEGKKQNIAEVLASKDKRVALQQEIFAKYPDKTLVDVNLNVPGPVKNNRYLEKLFNRGVNELEGKFKKNNFHYQLIKHLDEDTGSENFYVLDDNANGVKKVTTDFEDKTKLGRLFDVDVLIKGQSNAISRKDLGYPVRKCFLCNRPAKECSRSRRHSVSELQDYISKIYGEEFN
ncbi:citrate lyase holo-[acyl-carrier protein] synthase [Lactobacillus acetotolerans]|uniref:citrate lyase holo-[acyl-carrier protein] synthase n=1 Tax=Lactobacillus acetotolerans TaxID=1600 RepID=UPI0007B8690F|nr:citrate lyase holo-[acyl-carrier protein] synthase [Lactobacillus acetotolerans]QGV04639.1 citrate lyase holo-[acyl-carrier protein] synthase [Lactobacillus acetotolerans]